MKKRKVLAIFETFGTYGRQAGRHKITLALNDIST